MTVAARRTAATHVAAAATTGGAEARPGERVRRSTGPLTLTAATTRAVGVERPAR